jgi:hypothetical protein
MFFNHVKERLDLGLWIWKVKGYFQIIRECIG